MITVTVTATTSGCRAVSDNGGTALSGRWPPSLGVRVCRRLGTGRPGRQSREPGLAVVVAAAGVLTGRLLSDSATVRRLNNDRRGPDTPVPRRPGPGDSPRSRSGAAWRQARAAAPGGGGADRWTGHFDGNPEIGAGPSP